MSILTVKSFTHVFISEIPKHVELKEVYPHERDDEISKTSNERLRVEKYYAWRLLEYAVSTVFGKEFTKVEFKKETSGRWRANEFDFSISHSDGIIAVAVSDTNVGVDVERISAPRSESFAKRILTDGEYEVYLNTENDREEYLISKWTEKEAVFKSRDLSVFKPREIFADKSGGFKTDSFAIDGIRYVYSVFTEEKREVKINFVSSNIAERERNKKTCADKF